MMLSADAPFVKAAKCPGFTGIVADVRDVPTCRNAHAAASVNPFTSSVFANADLNLPLAGTHASLYLLYTARKASLSGLSLLVIACRVERCVILVKVGMKLFSLFGGQLRRH